MRIIVIGSGLAGLTAALRLRDAGHHVDIVTKGWGGLLLSSGTLDVYGWGKDGHPVLDPYAAIGDLVAEDPGHPYAAIGVDAVREGIDWLCSTTGLFAKAGNNVLIPTAIGAVRPTAAVQNTMVPSLMEDGKKFLVVGIRQFRDFPAAFIADNLARSPLAKVETRAVTISLAPRKPEADSTGTTFARAFDGTAGLDGPATRDALIHELRAHVRDGETVLLPAILGFAPDAYQEISAELGVPVGEVPVPPPSIPGRRINDVLIQLCRDKRIDISLNAEVIGFEASGGHVTALQVQRAGRVTTNKVDAVVASNDGTAGGAVAALAAQGLAGSVPVSGQDADFAALNRIALGTQTVSVWKDSRELGKRAAEIALQLAKGTDPKAVEGTTTFSGGPKKAPMNSTFLKPVPITKDNLDVIIEAGWVPKATVCQGVKPGTVKACN